MRTEGFDSLDELDRAVAWNTGCTLKGLNFKRKDDGWLLTVKVVSRQKKHQVTFIHAETMLECLNLMWAAMTTNSFTLTWKDDKWA